MTKSKIKEKCVQLINEILCEDTLDYYQEYFRTSVKDKKSDLIQFYYDVKDTVERIREEIEPSAGNGNANDTNSNDN